MRKKTKAPSYIILAILTTITIVFWVAFEVYREFSKEPDPVVPAEIILPLDPTLDEEALNKLQNRISIDESNIAPLEVPISPTPTPEEELEELPSPSPTGEDSTEETQLNE